MSKITQHRILAGIRPTGKLHIGHYFGMLEQTIDMQLDYFAKVA